MTMEAPLDEVFDTQLEVERNPCGAWEAIQTLAAQLAEAKRERDEATLVLAHLERCAQVVSERGAVTGPQWARLTTAILKARMALRRLPVPVGTGPRMVQSETMPAPPGQNET
jgi:hypothetical protein